MHNDGAGGAGMFPELWNSTPGSLAGGFRIAWRDCGLEESLEFDEGRAPARPSDACAESNGAVREIPP